MQDGVFGVDESHDPHVLERNDPPDGGRDPIEDLLELEGLGGDFGDLCEDAGYGFCIDRLHDTHAATPEWAGEGSWLAGLILLDNVLPQ